MKTDSQNNIHKRAQAAVFRGKAGILQLKRGFENLFDPKIKRHSFSNQLANAPVIAASKTPLWTESAAAEQFLLAGKIHNLRLAAEKINGLEIPAGEVFSFWKNVGRAAKRLRCRARAARRLHYSECRRRFVPIVERAV